MAGLARPVCLRAGLALQAVEEALAVFRRCLRVPGERLQLGAGPAVSVAAR
jgi:hypothetical protein